MPSIASAAPFPALYNPQMNAMGGARSVSQPLVTSSGLKSPEHLEELWSGRGSPMRMENTRSSAPAPWMSEFNSAGPGVAGGSTQMQPQPAGSSPPFSLYEPILISLFNDRDLVIHTLHGQRCRDDVQCSSNVRLSTNARTSPHTTFLFWSTTAT